MEGFVVGGRESTLLKTVSFLLSVSVVSRNSGKCRTQVHFSVSDTGWIFFFPLRKNNKSNTRPPTWSRRVPSWWTEANFPVGGGGFPKAARCQKNNLQAIIVLNILWEASHRSKQGWQQFYRRCFSSACVFLFALFGDFLKQCRSNHRVSEGDVRSDTTVKDSYWKSILQQARLSTNEWIHRWTNVLKKKKKGNRTFGEIRSEDPKWRRKLWMTCAWRCSVHTDIEYNQKTAPKETESIDQSTNQPNSR